MSNSVEEKIDVSNVKLLLLLQRAARDLDALLGQIRTGRGQDLAAATLKEINVLLGTL